MANTRKPATTVSKLSSANARPKVTASTKENTQPRSSTTSRPTSALRPPLSDASSNGAKDAETAAMLASLRAEIDQLKKLQAAKPIEKKQNEIPRPARMTTLQDAMDLTENKKLYTYCRSVVRDVIAHAGLPTNIDWRNQDAVAIGKVAQVASSRCPQLQRYKGNWATLEIMKTLLKNRRAYRVRIGSLDDEHDEQNKKEINGEDGENGGNNSEIDDWEDMYVADKQIRGEDEIENGGEDGDENGVGNGRNGGEDRDEDGDVGGDGGKGNISGYGDDDEEFGGNDNEERNGEGSCSAKKAGKKRKVTRDDEPATAARLKRIRKETDGGKGRQVATRSNKKVPKRK